MGYFSNGSEGSDFDQKYCDHCVNMPLRADADCPIRSAHLLFGYQLCNEKQHPGKVILDMLIEREGTTNRCVMFIDKRLPRRRTAADVELDAKARPKLIDWAPKGTP